MQKRYSNAVAHETISEKFKMSRWIEIEVRLSVLFNLLFCLTFNPQWQFEFNALKVAIKVSAKSFFLNCKMVIH